MKEIQEVTNIKKVNNSIYDCSVKFKNDNKFYPVTVNIKDPKDLQYLANYLKNNNLIKD